MRCQDFALVQIGLTVYGAPSDICDFKPKPKIEQGTIGTLRTLLSPAPAMPKLFNSSLPLLPFLYPPSVSHTTIRTIKQIPTTTRSTKTGDPRCHPRTIPPANPSSSPKENPPQARGPTSPKAPSPTSKIIPSRPNTVPFPRPLFCYTKLAVNPLSCLAHKVKATPRLPRGKSWWLLEAHEDTKRRGRP